MKTLIILIFSLVGLISQAQQVELIENTWYLSELTINGVKHLPPSNEEIDGIVMNITNEDNNYFFESEVCSTLGGLLNWVTNSQFSFFDFVGGYDCQYAENRNYELLYANFYGGGGSNGVPFNYIIETTSENFSVLTVTNHNGNYAVYRNQNLSLKENDLNQLTIFPNPVIDKVILSNSYSLKELNIKIFDSNGRLIKLIIKSRGQNKFDLSILKDGLYYIIISNSSNEVLLSQKIYKM